jgi:predicted dehydrogenase
MKTATCRKNTDNDNVDRGENRNGKEIKSRYYRYMDSFAEEMKQFVNALINDTDTPVTGFDGLQSVRLGLAAKKSAAEGRPVKLNEIEMSDPDCPEQPCI